MADYERSETGRRAEILRGEKWFYLMTPEQLAKEPENSSKPTDVAVYLESVERVKAKIEEKKEKPKKAKEE